MKTKNNHTSKYLNKSSNIIDFFFEYAQLKNLYRQGWLNNNVSERDCESVADHSFGVSLLGYIIAEEFRPDLDSKKIMLLGMLHEIGEIYTGDITPLDNINIEEKTKLELNSVEKVFSKLSNSEKYVNLWLEYERGETSEAKFVKQVDKLEMVLQAHLYEKMNYNNLDEFFVYVKERISSPELKQIFEDLIKSR
jgi:putative hydrolases of HD superfamily